MDKFFIEKVGHVASALGIFVVVIGALISIFYKFVEMQYEINNMNHKIVVLQNETNGLSDSLDKFNDKVYNDYVDKNYFWRDMNIIKNDINSLSQRTDDNTKLINQVSGEIEQLNVDKVACHG